jgi:hypothetical protein
VPTRLASHLAWQIVDGEGIVIDLERRRVLGFNPAGSLILSLLPDHDEEAIAAEVARTYEVDLNAARIDVTEFLTVLRARGLAVDA